MIKVMLKAVAIDENDQRQDIEIEVPVATLETVQVPGEIRNKVIVEVELGYGEYATAEFFLNHGFKP